MADIVFEAVQEVDGGYCADCLTENIFTQSESIFTQGESQDELRINVMDATTAFFFDQPQPRRIRLHLVGDEILSVA